MNSVNFKISDFSLTTTYPIHVINIKFFSYRRAALKKTFYQEQKKLEMITIKYKLFKIVYYTLGFKRAIII